MKRCVVAGCLWFCFVSVFLFPRIGQTAEPSALPLYVRTIMAHPKPVLDAVNGREYKFLLDPARIPAEDRSPEQAFAWIWKTVATAAARQGYTFTEKAKAPFDVELSTKAYYDTPEGALRARGYLLRLNEREKAGQPDGVWRITVKAIQPDTRQVLQTPLKVVGAESETAAEENLGLVEGGLINGYVEKGVDFKIKANAMNPLLLSGWGTYLPELLELGLPADTTLVERKAFAWRVKPGTVALEGLKPCGVTIEAWAEARDALPYVYDFSYGYDNIDFYGIDKTHAAGEALLGSVFFGQLWNTLALPNAERWGGSKVRLLLRQPL